MSWTLPGQNGLDQTGNPVWSAVICVLPHGDLCLPGYTGDAVSSEQMSLGVLGRRGGAPRRGGGMWGRCPADGWEVVAACGGASDDGPVDRPWTTTMRRSRRSVDAWGLAGRRTGGRGAALLSRCGSYRPARTWRIPGCR